MEIELARFRRAYWQAFRELDSVRMRQWERSRLTLPQLRVLHRIRRVPGITTGELATMLGLTVSTVSGLVIKLTDRGLVERTTAADDRRQGPLHLTTAGEAISGEFSEESNVYLARVAGELGPALGAVTEALERLVAASADASAAATISAGEHAGQRETSEGALHR
jgi:DNA-binding MarR family transcriptional regulator